MTDPAGEDPSPDPVPDPDTTPDPTPEVHESDGLDLARAASRAQRGQGPPAGSDRRSGRTGAGTGSGRRGGPGRRRRSGRAGSGAHPDDRDPQAVGDELDRLVARHGWEPDLRVRGVFERWPELVGDDVAAHCRPESLADARLVVRTDSTAWATQLSLLAPTLVRRLNEELGDGVVSVIDVQGPHLPSWRKGPRSARDGRGPRDTYG